MTREELLAKPGAGFTRIGETFGRPINEATEEELQVKLRTM